MSKHNPVAKAINYMFEKEGRWEAFTRFLDDGRLCLTNNAAERALRGIALGRKSWLFAGSHRGGERAAFMYSLIVTALCRARHKAVYADRRTMPSVSSLVCGKPCVPGQFGGALLFGTRHSSHAQRAFRNSRSRSLGRNRSALARSYGFSFASADSFSSRCA